jgi:hypothetical protein
VDPRLPEDWPLPEIRLPKDAEVFEGRVEHDRELSDGRRVDQYAAFFTSSKDFDAVRSSLERRLRKLGFALVEEPPEAVPIGSAGLSLHTVYASNDGFFLVTLLYDRLAQAPAENMPQEFYTLMVEQRREPLPPDPQWPSL